MQCCHRMLLDLTTDCSDPSTSIFNKRIRSGLSGSNQLLSLVIVSKVVSMTGLHLDYRIKKRLLDSSLRNSMQK